MALQLSNIQQKKSFVERNGNFRLQTVGPSHERRVEKLLLILVAGFAAETAFLGESDESKAGATADYDFSFKQAMILWKDENLAMDYIDFIRVGCPIPELAELYRQRWEQETNFGHVKTTMKLDVLKCKTVDGVLRELHVFALIYNLVRQVMVEAALRQNVEVNRISFIDALRWLKSAEEGDELRDLVILPERPNRYEPRVRKRRPKKYKLMNKPRKQLNQELATQ